MPRNTRRVLFMERDLALRRMHLNYYVYLKLPFCFISRFLALFLAYQLFALRIYVIIVSL